MRKLIEAIQNYKESIKVDVPPLVYHATYRPLLKQIMELGLVGGKRRNWECSNTGRVYVAKEPEVAESYAETSEFVPADWLDEIIIFEIDTSQLDISKFGPDPNVLDSDGETLQYAGTIPVHALRLLDEYVE